MAQRILTDRLMSILRKGDVVYIAPRGSDFAWPMRVERHAEDDGVIGRVKVPRNMLRFMAREGSLMAERGDVPDLDGVPDAYTAHALAKQGRCDEARALIAGAGDSAAAEYARDQIEERCAVFSRRGVRFDESTRRKRRRKTTKRRR